MFHKNNINSLCEALAAGQTSDAVYIPPFARDLASLLVQPGTADSMEVVIEGSIQLDETEQWYEITPLGESGAEIVIAGLYRFGAVPSHLRVKNAGTAPVTVRWS